MPEAYVYEVVRYGATRAQFEKTAEGRRGHPYESREVGQAYLFFIMGVDVFLYFRDATAVAGGAVGGKR